MELFLLLITAIIVHLWFKQISLVFINRCFYDFKYDCCRFVWNISSCIIKKMNIDPALASSVFVTTITDVIGFLSF